MKSHVPSAFAAPHPIGADEQKVAAYFESTATNWDTMYSRRDLWGHIHQQRLARFMAWVDRLQLTSGTQVFDVGCGAGLASVGLAERGFVVESTDVCPSMIELTRKNADKAGVTNRVHAEVGDIYNLGFPDGYFSLVLSIGVVPWLEHPARAIGELARVLKPGGHMLFTMDNRSRLARLLDPATSPPLAPFKRLLKGSRSNSADSAWPQNVVPAHQHSLQEVDAFLAQVNLKRLYSETLGFGPFTFFYRTFLPVRFAVALNRALQWLGDRHTPVFRSTGGQFLLLTKKRA